MRSDLPAPGGDLRIGDAGIIKVPELVGLAPDEAAAIVREASLLPAFEHDAAVVEGHGRVIGQAPAAGAAARTGDVVVAVTARPAAPQIDPAGSDIADDEAEQRWPASKGPDPIPEDSLPFGEWPVDVPQRHDVDETPTSGGPRKGPAADRKRRFGARVTVRDPRVAVAVAMAGLVFSIVTVRSCAGAPQERRPAPTPALGPQSSPAAVSPDSRRAHSVRRRPTSPHPTARRRAPPRRKPPTRAARVASRPPAPRRPLATSHSAPSAPSPQRAAPCELCFEHP
ncbi:PASTA domain-containing protein [Conexibacter stalactiti]|uniref:PASTA domain-containing protein n=1 Tax=Conexibacter stalactiti TaxID=1940611 RepID=UPI00384F6472